MDDGYKIRNQNGIYFVTFAVVEWVDVFKRSIYADIVIDSLKHCQNNKGLVIYGWCLMSNHTHMIISTKEGFNLSDTLRDFKKFTSTRIIKAMEENAHESRRNWMLWLFKSAGEKNNKNKRYQFWWQSNQPKELETNEFKQQKLDYIHNNPVEAGVVREAHEYNYSSAVDYSGGKGLLDIEFL